MDLFNQEQDGKYDFINLKNQLLAFLKSISQDFERCFVVRNIYSRYVIYLIKSNNDYTITSLIREKFIDWIDNVEIISEENDQFVYNDLVTSSLLVNDTTNIYFSERHLENSNWYIKDTFSLNAPVTSFYSFKGGVGRTTATILTALILARQGSKVLLIDFDLEAPGLASVFANQGDNAESLLSVKGFVDFLVDYEANKRDITKINIDDYYFVKNDQILVGSNGGELVIVPAISTDSNSAASYIDKLSKANIRFGFGKEYLPDFFLKTIEEKIKPDHILIDTRTGINDVGGLVFNRYAQNIFLLFYGNQQNMFGLESILPELAKLQKNDMNFYLVNSPVPIDENLAKIEIDYYVERSYEIFLKHYYADDNIPSQFDETADHYPINITYNSQALILNSNKKLASLVESTSSPYHQIANIIKNSELQTIVNSNRDAQKDILKSIINIDSGSGASEIEFKDENDLKKYFYPRIDYKYIFEKDKFLILGEKGVGKTALFSVLSHRNYTEALAKFCGVNTLEIENTRWIIGFEKDKDQFPDKANFEALNEFQSPQFRNYWIILLIRQLEEDFLPDANDENAKLVSEIRISNLINLKIIAKIENVGEHLLQILYKVNDILKFKNQTFIIVYDHLDAVLPTKDGIRGKLVSALLSFFYDNINRLDHIKAKIFLRNDIFHREVSDLTDKVKISNYSQKIEWQYDQLLNVIWKRIYEQNKDSPLFESFDFEQFDLLGSVPTLDSEKEHKEILDAIFGKNMGGNNKAYPYNWVRLHIEDTNSQIHPRTLIKLFGESAKLESKEKEVPKDRIIRSKNIETALEKSVSTLQVQELGEEYPELQNVFNDLSSKVGGRSPMIEKELISALVQLNEEPLPVINKLKDIGVLKDYKPYSKTKTENEERRYHIPDLYLYGLNFTRKGTK